MSVRAAIVATGQTDHGRRLDVSMAEIAREAIDRCLDSRGLEFEDIHDLFAFRIIVDSVKDCYEALGIVHGAELVILRWRPSDVARVELQRTLGAQIIGLIFAHRTIEMRLGLYKAGSSDQAQRLLDQASSSP